MLNVNLCPRIGVTLCTLVKLLNAFSDLCHKLGLKVMKISLCSEACLQCIDLICHELEYELDPVDPLILLSWLAY